MNAADYEVIRSGYRLWRVVRIIDGALAGRDMDGADGATVRDWGSEKAAKAFIAAVVKGHPPSASMFLAWMVPRVPSMTPAQVEAAEERDMGPLAGVWITDFYRGGPA